MRNFIYKALWVLVLTLGTFCCAQASLAASVQLQGPTEKVLVNQDFRINLVLDAQGQNINAIGGRLTWPDDLEIRAILTADSVVSLWSEAPHYDGSTLVFSGVMPGGYNGNYSNKVKDLQPGLVFSLVVRAKKPSESIFKFSELAVYPNDGSGQALVIEKPELRVSAYGQPVSEIGAAPEINNDKTPPQDLTASIEHSPEVADGKWFVVFAAHDQESGIKAFYISESKNNTPNDDWLPIGSPFVLTDQTRTKYVFIKAVDLNNNEAMVTLEPLSAETPVFKNNAWLIRLAILAVLGAGVIIIALLIKKIRQRYAR